MKRLLLAAIFLSPLAASAAIDPFGNIHSIAIESSLGDGLTLKQNSDWGGKIAPDTTIQTGAGIDEYVKKTISEALAGRFQLVDAATGDPDAIIRVQPAEITQSTFVPPVAMSFHYSGLSATRGKGLFGASAILLSAQYEVWVLDGKTKAVISRGVAQEPATGIFHRRTDPIEHCKLSFWPNDLDHPSDSELKQIRADILAIVAASLPNALQGAGLSSSGNDTKLTQWEGTALLCEQYG